MSNASNSDTFVMTAAQVNFANFLSEACTIPGTCVCFLVLIAYAIAACFPRARKYMDRVSFRLSVYTLIFNVFFGIAYAATPGSPGAGCSFGAFCVNLFLSFSTFFTTCIAINLQLVVVHHIDGQRMEKYYLIGTTLLSIALNVPTLALHQFGWDEGSGTCWYSNSNSTVRLHWIIGTQSFWIALAATIETICSGVVLVYIYIYQMKIRALIFNPPIPSQLQINGAIDTADVVGYRQSTHITQEPRYRKAILRIVLYPIISLMINYTTVALDLNNTIQGVNSQTSGHSSWASVVLFLSCVTNVFIDLFIYGIRTLSYGLLAAMDLSFITAVREVLDRNKSKSEKECTKLEFAATKSDQSDIRSQGTLDVVGVQVNVNPQQSLGLAQDLESGGLRRDCELEFPKIERQL